MKKFFGFVLVSLFLVGLLPVSARADIGPKPSVTVTFDQKCYATLLSKESRWGPYVSGNVSKDEIGKKFESYLDPDGFYFLQEWWDCTADNSFTWSYYPPNPFKILVYFPETDTFASSEILERYAFESYFQCSFSDGGMRVRSNYDYKTGITGLLVRAVLTVILELAVALLFGYRSKRSLAIFAVVNVITQFALYISLYLATYWRGPWAYGFWFVVGELLVLAAEAIAYTLLVEKRSRVRWYALAANALSCCAGLFLSGNP